MDFSSISVKTSCCATNYPPTQKVTIPEDGLYIISGCSEGSLLCGYYHYGTLSLSYSNPSGIKYENSNEYNTWIGAMNIGDRSDILRNYLCIAELKTGDVVSISGTMMFSVYFYKIK